MRIKPELFFISKFLKRLIMVCQHCKRYPCMCHALYMHAKDIRKRQGPTPHPYQPPVPTFNIGSPYSPICQGCGLTHRGCLCRNSPCRLCKRRVCQHSNLRKRSSQLLNLNIGNLYLNLSSDMQEAMKDMNPKDQNKMESALDELKEAIQRIYSLPPEQRKKIIDEAHNLAAHLEERKAIKDSKEGFVPYWMISRRRFLLPRRFWGWRRYLNPYMWYYYRPYYW